MMKRKTALLPGLILLIFMMAEAASYYLASAVAAEIHMYPGDDIQAAIEAADSGAVITLEQGIYMENIDYVGKAITIRSTDPNDPDVVAATIIDGNQVANVVTFDSGEGSGSVLSGITIRNGRSYLGGGIYCDSSFPTINRCIITGNTGEWGGGICCDYSSPTIRHCIIEGNTASYGGGIEFYQSSGLTVTNCRIAGNSASGDGGGIYCDSSSPNITHCIISSNTGHWGGGIYSNFSSPIISHCTIEGNTASFGGGIEFYESSKSTVSDCLVTRNSSSLDGGGIYCCSSSLSIMNCRITDNHGEWGGGICCDYSSSPELTRCTFRGNSAIAGGGIECYDSSSPIFTNCLIFENTAVGDGGGIGCDYSSSPVIHSCTISRNTSGHGGGIFCDDTSLPVITNCILWGDSPDEIYTLGHFLTSVSYSDIQAQTEDVYSGPGNLHVYPSFVDPNKGDYHLTLDSPCLDAGTGEGAPDEDREGTPRPCDGDDDGSAGWDMGAYEYVELMTLRPGLNLVSFPRLFEAGCSSASDVWDVLIGMSIPMAKIQTYRPEPAIRLTFQGLPEENFPLPPYRTWLVYMGWVEGGFISFSLSLPLPSQATQPVPELFRGANLVSPSLISEVIGLEQGQITWPKDLFHQLDQGSGLEGEDRSTCLIRYDGRKAKWQAEYPFFNYPAGSEAGIKKREGYILYIR